VAGESGWGTDQALLFFMGGFLKVIHCGARWRAGGEMGGEARVGGFLKVIPTVGEDCEQEG
jgi:hypothetical protein